MVRQSLPGPINSEEYHIHIPDSVLHGFPDPTKLRSRPRNVDALRRYWGKVPTWWPCPNYTDCAWPLYLHYLSVKYSGQMVVAQELYYILSQIQKRWKKYSTTKNIKEPELYIEDYYRHHLKQVSSYCYQQTFEQGPAYMLLVHLHALNAKSPYTKEQIINDITTWVSDELDGKKKEINMEVFGRVVRETVSAWPKKTKDSLSFNEYANDPFRWGTSGGAPSVIIHGEKTRSKWAWAISKKIHPEKGYQPNVDLEAEAEEAQSTAKVALKEESQKTREIITTPLSSYLRQSYLLYLMGSPPLPSPIASPNWLPQFEAGNYSWYGCIDGERFDHCIPKSAVILLLKEIGKISEEARIVADKEIQHLEELQIEWCFMTWAYQGGLLSGWRWTSLLGTLISKSAAEYVIEKTGKKGMVLIGAMGDDIALYSNTTSISKQEMVDAYNEFGLRANLHKTVSGPQGEFLRKVRSPGGSWAFPALDTKTITHASPWIQNYQFQHEEECATAWHTLLSRLLPHATDPNKIANWTQKHCINHLNQKFGRNPLWENWLQTPLTAGGGGYVENSNPSVWHSIEKEQDRPNLTPYEKLGQLVGTLPYKKTFKKIELRPIDITAALKYRNKISSQIIESYVPRFTRTANITKTVWQLLTNTISIKELNTQLETSIPHRMRMYSGPRLANILASNKKQITSIPSIVHTRETLPQASKVMATLTKNLLSRKGLVPSKLIKPVATLFAIDHYQDILAPYGTW